MKRTVKTETELSVPSNTGIPGLSDRIFDGTEESPGGQVGDPPVPTLIRRGPVPAEAKKLAQQMLAEGASPEEVIAASRAHGFGRVTEATIKHWLSRDPRLRERALKRQLEAIKALEKKLGEGGGPAKLRLADAARFAGLARSGGIRSRLALPKLMELHGSMWDSLQRENVALKHRALELEAQKASMSRRIEAVRTRVDRMRWQVVQKQLDQLWNLVSGSAASERLASPLADTLRNLYRAAGRKTDPPERTEHDQERRPGE